jgi:hypothetical protein
VEQVFLYLLRVVDMAVGILLLVEQAALPVVREQVILLALLQLQQAEHRVKEMRAVGGIGLVRLLLDGLVAVVVAQVLLAVMLPLLLLAALAVMAQHHLSLELAPITLAAAVAAARVQRLHLLVVLVAAELVL